MKEDFPADRLHQLVSALDRSADRLLRAHWGLSHQRGRCLVVLQRHETITQHELAVALGCSDPAVSAMLLALVKDGYVSTSPSPEHGRKRLVSLTPAGQALVAEA